MYMCVHVCVHVCMCACVHACSVSMNYFVSASTHMFLPNPIAEALKMYRECREKEPTLQKEFNEVNNEIERKPKEIELPVSTILMDADEVNSRAIEPTPPHPHTLPFITKSPTRKDPTLKMLPGDYVNQSVKTAQPLFLWYRSWSRRLLLNLQWRRPNQLIRDYFYRRTH